MTRRVSRGDLLDPELASVIDKIPFTTLTAETLLLARGAPRADVERSGAVERSDRVVPGDPPVRVSVYRPVNTDNPRPCVYSMHGGGFVAGSYINAIDDRALDRWCAHLGMIAVSVDYRLAPDTPYPGPLEDCYAGLHWVHEHAEELGIDPGLVGVRGLSAGGGLAAALALLARDRGGPKVAFQLLDCPMLDDLHVWNRESNTFGWRSYLGALYGRDDVPYHAAPARAEDLSGAPPAFICVGDLDGFRDEDIDYALRLTHAGVPTELHVYSGAPHGFQLAIDSSVYRRSLSDVEEWLALQLRLARRS
jgi:acetyl esterase/lipase